MKTEKTFIATIHIGLKEGYDGRNQTTLNDNAIITNIIRDYCMEEKVAVTIMKQDFEYPGGNEPGLRIEFIQYPRFPRTELSITKLAINLAEKLMIKLGQYRCTVVCTDNTYMLENPYMK